MVLNKHNYVLRVVYINVEDDHVQNKVFEGMDSYYIKNASIRIGYDVTDTLPYGIVLEGGGRIKHNKNSTFKIPAGVTLEQRWGVIE